MSDYTYQMHCKWTGRYGDTNPATGKPEITVTPVEGQPGVYNYEWTTHNFTLTADQFDGTLSQKLKNIDRLTFYIYPQSTEQWENFYPNRTAVQLERWRWQGSGADASGYYELIFSGRVADVENCMDEDGKIYKIITCESEMAYFCDSLCDTKDVIDYLEENDLALNTHNVLETMIWLHNKNTGGIAGTITKNFTMPSTPFPSETLVNAFEGDINTTFNLLQKVFVEEQGWDIWITHDDSMNKTSWDYGYLIFNAGKAGSLGKISSTPIKVGSNMKSLSVNYSPTADGRITRIVPLGGIGQDGRRLNVESIEQYHEGWTTPDHSRAIANEWLNITYGQVDKVVLYEDLVDDGNKTDDEIQAMIRELYRRGKALADGLSDGITSINVSAVDLKEAGYDAESFEVGNFYRIINEFVGLDDTFRLVEKNMELSRPYEAELIFGKTNTKSTSQNVSQNVDTSNRIYNVENMIQSRLDNTSVKKLTAELFDTLKIKNENTIYYVTQPDGSVWEYKGDIRISGGGSGGGSYIEHANVITQNQADDLYVVEKEEVPLEVGQYTQVLYGGERNKFYMQGLTILPKLANGWNALDTNLINILPEDCITDADFYFLIGEEISKLHIHFFISRIAINANGTKSIDATVNVSTIDGNAGISGLRTLTVNNRSTSDIVGAGAVIARSAFITDKLTDEYPFGGGNINIYPVIIFSDSTVSCGMSIENAKLSSTAANRLPFASQAELDFALNITTRSELIDNG